MLFQGFTFVVYKYGVLPCPPGLRHIRDNNKELYGHIKALAHEPRSDVLTEASVREKEGVVVSLRTNYNTWKGRGLAREKHVANLKAEWEVSKGVSNAVASSTDFFNADVDAAVTLRGVPSLGDMQRTLGAMPPPGAGGKGLEKMNSVELRAALEEAAHRLQSVELSLGMVKQTRAELDHMIKRFVNERMGEETKYAGIKQSIEAILRQEKEHVLQVKIVGHDEDVARTKIAALQEFLSKVAAKRKNLVTQEKGKMSTKAELEDYVKNRGHGRRAIVENVAGDLNTDEEVALKAAATKTNARVAMTAMDKAHADKLEQAFTVIAERTGDDDIHAFVNRFLTLVEIGKHADSGKEAMEERTSELRRTLDTLQQQLTELQDGGMSISIRRNEFNDLEDELNEKEKTGAHLHASSDEVNHRLSHLRVGVTAFAGKLEAVASKLSPDTNTPRASSSEDPTIRQLQFVDSCLERMLAAVDASGGDTQQKPKQQRNNRMASLAASLEEDSEDDFDVGTMRAEFEYNLRVKEGATEGSLTVDGDPLFDDLVGYPDDDDDLKPGIVPDGGHLSVAGLAREAKEAVMKNFRRDERRRLRQAEESTRKSSKALRSSTKDAEKKQPGSKKGSRKKSGKR